MAFIRKVRITFMFLVLFFVAANTWLIQLRTTDWNEPLWVAVYPINGDGNGNVDHYMAQLTPEDFDSIESFMAREARRHGLAQPEPVTIKLAPEVAEHPPLPPEGGSRLAVILWSLKLRYWAYRNNPYDGPDPDIQIYVVYHDPQLHGSVGHSVGLQKGLIGVVNAYASQRMAGSNNVIITHELLHTVGASDKYHPETAYPRYPDGFAEPDRNPLLPQHKAEIMGGRIPMTEDAARVPASLSKVTVGERTAEEIRWIDPA